MHNQPEMKAVSVQLYKYLGDEIVGSEKVVRCKRLYCKLHDDLLNDSESAFISSGSMAEGLTLPGSDIDFMYLLTTPVVYLDKFCEVYEDYENESTQKEDVIILETENALPGFALLKVAEEKFPITHNFDGTLIACVANSDILEVQRDQEDDDDEVFEIHGPSLSSSLLHDIDMVICLKCQTWPKVAHKWLCRYRPSGWPSHDIISNIVSHGVLLVPVGSKSLNSEGHPFEWRFSFSLSEKLLVYSFNHTQLLCHSLLKLFLKEVVDADNILNKRLCSYYMKTVLFWILEEDDNLNWIPENLIYCFRICIQRLHYWILCGYIPNYFIPEHNMLEGKLPHEILSYLTVYLDKMNMQENWKTIFSASSLCNFQNTQISISRKFKRIDPFNKAVLSLRTFSTVAFGFSNYYTGEALGTCILYRMLRKHLPISVRKMLTVMFLKGNKTILSSIDVLNDRNKCSYLRYKECLSRVLINTFYDDVFGWLLLAAYFYSTQEYHKMSQILLFASSALSQNREIFLRASHVDNRGFSSENYQFLNGDFPNIGTLGCNQSQALFFFLNFLYSRKQGSPLETQSALKLLKQTVNEKRNTPIHMILTSSTYDLLHKAFELLNDLEGDEQCELEELKAITNSDKFDAFFKWAKNEADLELLLELLYNYYYFQFIRQIS